ncbi:MAG: DUF624 domain-containing protein [Lachnospiraceae bacterium]|nr:DUF624 domain-containing protein [Lachnospiraceae bacterium]
MIRSFFFDPDSGLLLFFGRFVDFLWLSIMMVIGCIPIITVGASVSAGLYCCRKMYLHKDDHLTKMFWDSYKANMKKGIPLLVIMLDVFLILGGLVMIAFFDERIFGKPLNVPVGVAAIILFLFFACLLAAMHVLPLNAYFENTVANTLKNSFLVAVTNLPVTLGLLVVNALPFWFCYMYPALWFFEIFFGVGFCAFCSAQLYRKVLAKLGVEEIVADEPVSTEAADEGVGTETADKDAGTDTDS